MAAALVASVSAGSSDANTVVTDTRNTTAANVFVALVGSYYENPEPAVSDSKSNIWLGPYEVIGNTAAERIAGWYCIPSSVGSGHYFSATQISSYCSIGVLAFSGAATTLPLDQKNKNSANLGGVSGSTIQTGSVTPLETGEIIVAGVVGSVTTATTISGGFSIIELVSYVGGLHWSLGVAYKIQAAIFPENPSWVMDAPITTASANIFTFKEEVTATGQPMMRRWGGTPFVGGQGIGNKGTGRAWGKTRSGLTVPRRFQEIAA